LKTRNARDAPDASFSTNLFDKPMETAVVDTESAATSADPSADPSPDQPLREQVAETICLLLPEVLKREVTGTSADTALMEALGLTSTTGLELVLRIEESLELEISVEDLDRGDFETVGSLADYVAGNLLD
jgi:acyl carrier protein